jgi:spore germination protein YaaH
VKRLLVLTVLLLAVASVAAAGIHEWEHNAHRRLNPAPVIYDHVPPLAKSKAVGNYVLGFYPYWSTGTADLPLDALDEIAYFGLEIDGQGNVTNWRGWPRDDLVTAAHNEGVRVTLTVICFSQTNMNTLLPSATNRTRLIGNVLDAVAQGAADGVNLDFEGLPAAQKQNFVVFVQELHDALLDENPSAALSIDTPAVDWSGAFDFDALAAEARLFVMAYDYHYKGGDPGPVAPLFGSTLWGQYAYDWTFDDYETYLAPYTLGRVIVGMPLYGYDWPSTGPEVPGEATGTASARTILEAWDMAATHGGATWDSASRTVYLTYQDAGWRQLWYENLNSLDLKFAYAQTRGAGGIGFWTVTYGGANPGLWNLVRDYRGGDDDDDDDDDTVPPADDDDDDDSGGCGGVVF